MSNSLMNSELLTPGFNTKVSRDNEWVFFDSENNRDGNEIIFFNDGLEDEIALLKVSLIDINDLDP